MDEKSVAYLSDGLLKIYEPALVKTESTLKELTVQGSKLLDQIHQENLSLSELQHSSDLVDICNKIELYQTKLVNFKKDMKYLYDKSTKLKKSALRIQQFKEKQDLMKQQKEVNLKMEQDLIPKRN